MIVKRCALNKKRTYTLLPRHTLDTPPSPIGRKETGRPQQSKSITIKCRLIFYQKQLPTVTHHTTDILSSLSFPGSITSPVACETNPPPLWNERGTRELFGVVARCG